jgi:transcription termination factor NusB
VSKENRRQARIHAVQQLYGCEMRGVLVPLAQDPAAPLADEELEPFARELIDHALGRLPEIDALLAAALQNWDLRSTAPSSA